MNRREPLLETAQSLRHGLPGRNVGVRGNDEGERTLNRREGADHLHQAAQPDLLGKVARRDHDDGKNERNLGVARCKPGQTLLPFHDLPKILEDAAEPLLEDAELHRLTTIKSDTFRIFPQAHQAETEIRFKPLLVEV